MPLCMGGRARLIKTKKFREWEKEAGDDIAGRRAKIEEGSLFVKKNAPIEASLESSNWEGFSKEEIETGTKLAGSRFQRAMRTLVSKNAITRYGNTRNTRYKLT